ncbi:MAG: hypothetical protein PVG61_04765 [Dehalococcoidia bacterium]|jgi:hypothetical protein
MDTFLEILKWIGIALAAGFVGYFGRIPAGMLLDKISGRGKGTPEKEQSVVSGDASVEELKTRRKIEKKKAKQAVKITKKMEKEQPP